MLKFKPRARERTNSNQDEPGVARKDEIRLPAMDADEHAPPPYDGTMSDPLASPSQSQTLNAARLARLRTAGRRTTADPWMMLGCLLGPRRLLVLPLSQGA